MFPEKRGAEFRDGTSGSSSGLPSSAAPPPHTYLVRPRLPPAAKTKQKSAKTIALTPPMERITGVHLVD